MSANTNIGWCHHTVNFWWGCEFAEYADGTKRPECFNCYAKTLSAKFSHGRATWGPGGLRWIRTEKAVEELLKIDASARKRGARERVFINSMSDTFEDRRDLDAERGVLFDLAARVTNLDLLLLTKRHDKVLGMVPADWLSQWPAHVWMGATAATQKALDEVVPVLLEIPARVRWLSVEPLLETVNLGDESATFCHFAGRVVAGDCGHGGCRERSLLDGIHWAIIGGESGDKRRDCGVEAIVSAARQCAAAGVPVFVKQDCARQPGRQGRIPEDVWALKQFPIVAA